VVLAAFVFEDVATDARALKRMRVGADGTLYLLDAERLHVSTNGGLTWAVHTVGKAPASIAALGRAATLYSGVDFDARAAMSWSDQFGVVDFNFLGMLSMPYGTSDESYLDLTPDSPSWWSAPECTISVSEYWWGSKVARPGKYNAVPDEGGLALKVGHRLARSPGSVPLARDLFVEGTRVFVDTSGGEVQTDDGGLSWSVSTRVAPDGPAGMNDFARDRDTWLFATASGLVTRTEAVWEQGTAPVNGALVAVSVDPTRSQHYVAAAARAAYETDDAGRSWNEVYASPTFPLRDVRFDRAGALWVLTDRALLRRTLVSAGRNPPAPTLAATLAGAERRWEIPVDPAPSRWIPTLHVATGVTFWHGDAALDATSNYADQWFGVRPGRPAFSQVDVLARALDKSVFYAAMLLRWSLDTLVLPPAKSTGQGRTAEAARYHEAHRALVAQWYAQDGDRLQRALLRERIIEVTEQLNLMSGGAWAPNLEWIRQQPS
jgi:hypothetical protein